MKLPSIINITSSDVHRGLGNRSTLVLYFLQRAANRVVNTVNAHCYMLVRVYVNDVLSQIDIIGTMVIVWRVRGKIIRSVLCNIVRNNCAQCNAHTYERT